LGDRYGEISALVHIVCSMLASSHSGIGLVSDCLVAAAAVPNYRIAVGGVLSLIWAIVTLPARILKKI